MRQGEECLKHLDFGHITWKFGLHGCHIPRLRLSFGKVYPRSKTSQRI